MSNSFVKCLLEGNNYPSNGQVVFDSSDHIRFQNGQNVSGHNYGCNRRLVIEKNIQGDEGYTGEFYQFNLSSCIRQQNSLTAQFVSFSLANLANIFYPPNFYNN